MPSHTELFIQDAPDAFDAVTPELVLPAITELIEAANAALERAVSPDVANDFDALSAVLDTAVERLSRAWGIVTHLNAVVNTPELRAAHAECLPLITEFHTRLGADARLFAKYKAIRADVGYEGLSVAQRKSVANALRDFTLSGAELEGDDRTRYARNQEAQALLSRQFADHVLDATDGHVEWATEAEVDGLPADVRQAAQEAARAAGREGFKLTLHIPSYLPVMQYAHHRGLRERMYRAYITRASDIGKSEWDNSSVMRQLLELRAEQAKLLGQPSYAELSLAPKMASSADEVLAFLRNLAHHAKPRAERELAELQDFARSELGLESLQAWDLPYASEKLKEAGFSFSSQTVRQYFTEPKVLAGLFGVIERLFDVSIAPEDAPVWHPSVRHYVVQRGGKRLARFYLDAYARPGKRPGAWMDGARSRWSRPSGDLQLPVAHLVCNFSAPSLGSPALLTHSDVTTLFHEFGHGLHHLLTQVDVLGVSGISGVEWDAVELPSQFMENLCWEWELVHSMSSHVDTGEPLPRELFDKMLAAKNFQSGLQTLRQIEFALIDMRLHHEAHAAEHIDALIAQVRQAVSVVPVADFNRFLHSFSHIFAGGYAAGYYSYKWAEVLSADAWGAFEEEASGGSALNPATGLRYRREILEAGGSRTAMENFKAFRGREPQIEALLRHQGLVADTAAAVS